MKTVLFRTGSGSIPIPPPLVSGSPRVCESVGGVFKGEKRGCSSPRISLHFDQLKRRSIRRASSESDVIRSMIEGSGVSRTLTSFRAIIPAEDCDSEQDEVEVLQRIGSLSLTEDRRSFPGDELGFFGGGIGRNGKLGGSGDGTDGFEAGSFTDPRKIRAYYEEMLKSDPTNSLLLRNYGKYLHEVERDFVKAEEYYGRAILASPGDGEVLSLFGKLVWESEGDGSRAKSYFDQAIQASPDDCAVLGSYAHFMWEAEEDEEEVERETVSAGAAMVAAY